jgi:hypothetical protein
LLDVDTLAAVVDSTDAALVVADPLMAYLPSAVNPYSDQEVRAALLPLARLAEDRDIAIVLVRHLTKSHGGNAVNAGGGSIGLIGAARSALLVGKDPADPKRRILAVSKSNVADEAPSLAYRLVADDEDRVHVAWEGESHYTADELVEATSDSAGQSSTDAARDWLRDVLGLGPLHARELFDRGAERGYSPKVLRRARERLGVVPVQHRDGWIWGLPSADEGAQPPLFATQMPTQMTQMPSTGDRASGSSGSPYGAADQEGETQMPSDGNGAPESPGASGSRDGDAEAPSERTPAARWAEREGDR